MAEFHFAVSSRGLEEEVLGELGIPFTALSAEGFHRGEVIRNLLFPVRTVLSLFQSLRALKRFRPHVAFGTGGFVSGPALLAARMRKIPVVLVALDALPGVTIRMLAPIATKIYVVRVTGKSGISQARVRLGSHPSIEIIGTPVRGGQPIDRRTARSALGMARQGRLLFVTGGSQGSRTVNEVIAASLDGLLGIEGLSVLWQCGEDHMEGASSAAEEAVARRPAYDRPRVKVEPFLHEMVTAWSAADLALCRAGASTIAELGLFGVPSILVPLSSSAGGHQEANARAMERAGASRLIMEHDLDPDTLVATVRELVEGEELNRMANSAARMTHAGAAHRVAEGLVEAAVNLDEEERARLRAMLQGEEA